MCGMTRSEDVSYAINLGVDAIGLIFFSKSPRYVTIEKAGMLLKNIPPFVDVVAVMVNPEKTFVQQIINELPIQLLQFHGDESPEFCQQFEIPFIKAIQPIAAKHIQQKMDEFSKAQALLLDTPSESMRGGTGLSFDWKIIPRDLSKAFILAGGINESNVLDAIKSAKPYAVDVCSGIEVSPGVKDHQKMSQFIKALWGVL
jgi:phosphoribosylanthranilate isomerase